MLLTVSVQYQGYLGKEKPPSRDEFYKWMYEELMPPGYEFIINGKRVMINTVAKLIEQVDD